MAGRDDCAICLRGLLCQTSDGSLLPLGSAHPCGHCFHTECFEDWRERGTHLWRQAECPLCRASIDSYERIFLQSKEADYDKTAVVAPEVCEQSTGNALGRVLGFVAGAVGLVLVGFLAGKASSEREDEERKKRGDASRR